MCLNLIPKQNCSTKKESNRRLISLQIIMYLFPKSLTQQISQETMYELELFNQKQPLT